jgi:hypothetical protein
MVIIIRQKGVFIPAFPFFIYYFSISYIFQLTAFLRHAFENEAPEPEAEPRNKFVQTRLREHYQRAAHTTGLPQVACFRSLARNPSARRPESVKSHSAATLYAFGVTGRIYSAMNEAVHRTNAVRPRLLRTAQNQK